MQKTGLYILSWGLLTGIISILYFFGLLSGLPFFITLFISIAAFILAIFQFRKLKTETTPITILPNALMLLAICLIGQKAVLLTEKHGVWDAWAMWNMHAKYLTDADNWLTLFKNTEAAHTDYPLLLPANIAFFNKLTGENNLLLITYIFHLITTICIPVLIFIQTQNKNILFAAIGLFWLSISEYYITIASYQLADNLIAFFLLCAMIAADNCEADKKHITISTAMLGLCMWTKNEGIMLSLLFVLFYRKEFFQKAHIKYSLTGFALPIITLLVFKTFYAPSNDIVSGQGDNTIQKLLTLNRYDTIYTAIKKLVLENYYALTCLMALHILIRVITKRLPDKRILFILSACCAYFLVYVITPLDLNWHLFTSLNRIIHQIIPITVYTLIIIYSETFNFRFRTAFAANP